MFERADAHIHLFEGGFHGSFAGRNGVSIDEGALYDTFAADHEIRCALVVGYAAQLWCAGNNEWIAGESKRYRWARPLAYVDPRRPPGLEELERWSSAGFVGIVSYVFDEETAAAVAAMHESLWAWLVERRWLVSVNSRGKYWKSWVPVLERHDELRLLVSHLGLPEWHGATGATARRAEAPTQAAAGALASVTALAEFPGPRVKLSGFYAIGEPGYEYPHREVWPLVEVLLDRFGSGRLLWGSDFTPSLDLVSFPQTYRVFANMPFLEGESRRLIEGANLLGLLEEM